MHHPRVTVDLMVITDNLAVILVDLASVLLDLSLLGIGTCGIAAAQVLLLDLLIGFDL